jgi:hypothetical protein
MRKAWMSDCGCAAGDAGAAFFVSGSGEQAAAPMAARIRLAAAMRA